LDPRLLEILACPLCKGSLRHDRKAGELLCDADRLAYPIREGIPIMMVDQARPLDPPLSPEAGIPLSDGGLPPAPTPGPLPPDAQR